MNPDTARGDRRVELMLRLANLPRAYNNDELSIPYCALRGSFLPFPCDCCRTDSEDL